MENPLVSSLCKDFAQQGLIPLVFLLCSVSLTPAVVAQEQLPACVINSKTGQTLCNCKAGADPSVICGNRTPKLTRVPSGLPANITVLDVSSNAISIIKKGDFLYLESVRTLFLQQNEIATIEEGAFANLHSLRLLVLFSNRLSSIPDMMFQHLSSIQSIDLQTNNIRDIGKRAFLTLPSNSATKEVIIKMSGNNNVNCNCNIRAIRDWKDILPSNLTKVKFEGMSCGGRSFENMTNSDFPSCNDSQLNMFESTQKCISCQNALSQQQCDEQEASVCSSGQPMCQTRIQYSQNSMVINKVCSSYASCLAQERDNSRWCNVSHSGPIPSMLCTFCCVGPYCNLGDMGGRTNSFRLFVTFQMNVTFQPFMLDVNSSQYRQNADLYRAQIRDTFLAAEGGYSVNFLYLRNESPYTRVVLEVYATNLNTFNANQVTALLTERVKASAVRGLLKSLNVIQSSIYVGTELSFADKCPQERTVLSSGEILWRETNADITAFVSCPGQSSGDSTKYASRVCRIVNGLAQWAVANVDDCDDNEESDTTKKLKEIAGVDITPGNVNQILNQLLQLVTAEATLTAADVTLAMDTVGRVLKEGSALTQSRSTDSVTAVLSELIDVDPSVLKESNAKSDSAKRILDAVDQISMEGVLTGGKLMSSAPNLVLAAQAVDTDSFKGLTLTANSNDDVFQEGEVQILPNTDSLSGDISSLVLPPSLLASAAGSNRVAMSVHRTDKVFEAIRLSGPGDTGDGSDRKFVTKVNSHVMAASVVGQKINNLGEPVIITLVHANENSTNPRCVFWEENVIGGKGDWSSRGCRLLEDRSTTNTTTCACDHLTNFALLMDVYGRGEDLSDTDRKILSIISYVGCGVSLLALLFTLLTYFMFKKLRRDNPSKILVNLCLALAMSNLIFLVGMQDYAFNSLAGCKTVSVLLHFSLLASMCWMAVEAFYMYLALVLVFKTYFTNFILKCSVVGWGVPLIIVIITLAVNETDNYGPLNSGVCWLKGVAFYAAFVAPVCLILLVNFIAFGLVLRTILGLSGRKLNKSDSFTTAQQLRGAVGVVILLGLTWVFGFVAIDQASVVFYYLFAIFNSLQGLFIFIFYCLLKKEARNAWRRFCCKTGDEKSSAANTSKAQNENTHSRGAYSGTAATHHGVHKSSTDNSSNGHTTTTHSTTVSGSASSLRDIDADFSGADHTYENLNANNTSSQFKHNVKLTQISTAARPIQFTPGHTIPTETFKTSPPEPKSAPSAIGTGQHTNEPASHSPSQPSNENQPTKTSLTANAHNFPQTSPRPPHVNSNTSDAAQPANATKISISTDSSQATNTKKISILASTDSRQATNTQKTNVPATGTSQSSSTSAGAADPSSPRPLRFKAGHVEIGPRASTADYESSTSPTKEDTPQMSVADRIKQLNNTRL